MACGSQIAVRGPGDRTCLHHHRQTLDWFCETCHGAVCVICVSTFCTLHKGHDIVPLSEITPNNKQSIKRFINKTEQEELIQIQQLINSTEECLEKHLSHFQSIENEVTTRGIKLKEDIDVRIAETLSQLKHLEKENTQLLTNNKRELESKRADLRNQLTQCKETFQTGTDIQMFDINSRLPTVITLPKRPVLGTAKLSKNKSNCEFLPVLLGTMTLTKPGQSDHPIVVEIGTSAATSDLQLSQDSSQTPNLASPLSGFPVLSEWVYPCNIKCNVPASDGGVWTCELNNKHLTHMTSAGGVSQQLWNPVSVTGICVSPTTGKVWACSEEDNSVMQMTSAVLVHKFNTTQKPKCMCVTKDGYVIVGTTQGITKYTPGGKPSPMTTSQSKKPRMRSPCTIAECPVSGNIAVFDRDRLADGGEDTPIIIVTDKHLQELYRQQQHTTGTGWTYFDPQHVAFDGLGQLVVADYYNNCLHLLSGDGHYIGQLHMKINMPRTVCLDRQGVLWVLFGDMLGVDKVKRFQYST